MFDPACSLENFSDLWSGRIDADEPAQLATRLHQVIAPLQDESPAGLAIVGFCSDEGVRRNKGRVGACQAPDLLRKALANMPWDPRRAAWDAGNVVCQAEQLESAHQALADRVQHCLAAGHFPLVLGGGHEVAYGSWLGLAQHCESRARAGQALPRIGIINFDAHFDLRLDTHGCSSGTPFYQIAQRCEQQGWDFRYCCLGVSELSNTSALFRRADELNVSYRRDSDMGLNQLDEARTQLERFMDDCDLLYLTIDLDVLPASIAPGVSAPAPRGLGLDVLEPLIESVRQTGKLTLADVAEYNPTFDIDNWTARVAARLLHCIVK
ncbi:formimidoylglutamase [Marinobacterium aestuarii]|uniref:Formimidoylglutamase n=1 Tax=Marinobacterium aestuarii TaxID=1821621 RepID=A0A1A9EUF8_9GAMM|nr:formimidoylglutamase [Marinobacterium aestuarii]ANG61412.1 formimidoylglutamase [Marinobacterium aestuarii]